MWQNFIDWVGRNLPLTAFISVPIVLTVLGFLFKSLISHQLKKELQREKILFSKLHEMRAERLSELYSLLVEIHENAMLSSYAAIGSGSDPTRADTLLSENLDEAQKKFRCSRLFFSRELAKSIQDYLNEIFSHGWSAAVGHNLSSDQYDQKRKIHEELKENHDKKLTPILEKIESEFRGILGV